MIEFAGAFVGSLLGSAHCIGMCGGFAITIGATASSFRNTLARQLVYTAGRIFTYSFLGALGGFAGRALGAAQPHLVGAQQLFSFVAGMILVIVGAGVLGITPFRRTGPTGKVAKLCAPLFSRCMQGSGWFGFFTAGLATGFLPCGLVYAFLALAVASEDVTRGGLLMACFGLGTAPAMLLVGCGAGFVSHAARARILRTAAVLMIFMGGLTIYRAIPKEDGSCCQERTSFRKMLHQEKALRVVAHRLLCS